MVGTPRVSHLQDVHYIRRDFVPADRGVAKLVGTIPAGSVILKPASGVNVHTLFNGSGTDLLDVGVSNSLLVDPDFLATALVVSAIGFIPLDEAVSNYVSVDTDITATYNDANSDATLGLMQVVIAYIPSINGG